MQEPSLVKNTWLQHPDAHLVANSGLAGAPQSALTDGALFLLTYMCTFHCPISWPCAWKAFLLEPKTTSWDYEFCFCSLGPYLLLSCLLNSIACVSAASRDAQSAGAKASHRRADGLANACLACCSSHPAALAGKKNILLDTCSEISNAGQCFFWWINMGCSFAYA
jgi:hypothetical protein